MALTGSTVAFSHMTSLTGILVTAPGYVVQAWLFERGWALGGSGYAATMIVVSSLFWTPLLLLAGHAAAALARRWGHRRGP